MVRDANMERARSLTIKAKSLTLQAVSARLNQQAGFERAKRAALEAIRAGKSEVEILVAAGDAYFVFIKETCGVEKSEVNTGARASHGGRAD